MNLAEMGRRVKIRRLELGLDQEQLAEQIGRTRGYVSRLEAGKSGESLQDLVHVAHALGWKLSELIGEIDDELVAEVRRRMPDRSEIALSFERLARALPGQPESDQEFIKRSVALLVERYTQTPETDEPS